MFHCCHANPGCGASQKSFLFSLVLLLGGNLLNQYAGKSRYPSGCSFLGTFHFYAAISLFLRRCCRISGFLTSLSSVGRSSDGRTWETLQVKLSYFSVWTLLDDLINCILWLYLGAVIWAIGKLIPLLSRLKQLTKRQPGSSSTASAIKLKSVFL